LPTNTERRLEQLENILLFGGGVAAGTASGRSLVRRAAPKIARGAGRVALGAAKRHPVGIATTLAYLGYIHRDEIGEVADKIWDVVEDPFMAPGEALVGAFGPEGIIGKPGRTRAGRRRILDVGIRGRKISKANKAVKHAMGLLKAGSKRATGADKGKLIKGAFKIATKAAGLANPKTKSKIGKGNGKVKALARKIRSWW